MKRSSTAFPVGASSGKQDVPSDHAVLFFANVKFVTKAPDGQSINDSEVSVKPVAIQTTLV